jgi:hypothetical protein
MSIGEIRAANGVNWKLLAATDCQSRHGNERDAAVAGENEIVRRPSLLKNCE